MMDQRITLKIVFETNPTLKPIIVEHENHSNKFDMKICCCSVYSTRFFRKVKLFIMVQNIMKPYGFCRSQLVIVLW